MKFVHASAQLISVLLLTQHTLPFVHGVPSATYISTENEDSDYAVSNTILFSISCKNWIQERSCKLYLNYPAFSHWILDAQQYYYHPNHWHIHSYSPFTSHRRRCWMRFQPREELLPRIPLLTTLSWADPPLFALLSEPPERINRKIRRKVTFWHSCLPSTIQAFTMVGTKVSFHLMKLFLSPMRRMVIL